MNIFDSLERAESQFPGNQALIFKGKPTTYRELYEQACRLSAVLLTRGNLQAGSRVALFLPNIPEFVLCYYAVQRIGAIAVSLNVMLKRDEVAFILHDCGAQLLITAPQLLEQVPEHVAGLQGIVSVGPAHRRGCYQLNEFLT